MQSSPVAFETNFENENETSPSPLRQKRIHNRDIPLQRAKTGLKKICNALNKRCEAKFGCLPEGRYVLLGMCMAGVPSEGHNMEEIVVSNDPMIEELYKTVFPFHKLLEMKKGNQDEQKKKDEEQRQAHYFSDPGNGEARGSRVRELLQEAWNIHTKGTPFEGKKQMYKIVSENPDMKFTWWEEVIGDGIEFSNIAVSDPTISKKVFDYLGKMLYYKRIQPLGPSVPPPPPPHYYMQQVPRLVPAPRDVTTACVDLQTHPLDPASLQSNRCLRTAYCSKQCGHVGRCDTKAYAGIVEAPAGSVEEGAVVLQQPITSAVNRVAKQKVTVKRKINKKPVRRDHGEMTGETRYFKAASQHRHHMASLAQRQGKYADYCF